MKLLKYLTDKKEALKRQMEGISADFCDGYYLNTGSYLCDLISEYADAMVSVYYGAIFEFAKDNFDDVNDAIEEFGIAKDKNGRPDIVRTVQQGEFLANERLLYEDIDSIKELLIVNYLIDNVEDLKDFETEEEVDDAINEALNKFDENERMDRVSDFIDDNFKVEEGE